MNLSNAIAQMILDMLDEDGYTEIQRNELAETLGCVPSQINYVISSRFTPEHGYIVESKRGGGGYIRITRAKYDKGTALMHVVNNIGLKLDDKTARAHVYNLNYQKLLDDNSSKLILTATSENALRSAPPGIRDEIRASIFKQMLLALM